MKKIIGVDAIDFKAKRILVDYIFLLEENTDNQ